MLSFRCFETIRPSYLITHSYYIRHGCDTLFISIQTFCLFILSIVVSYYDALFSPYVSPDSKKHLDETFDKLETEADFK